MFYSNPAKSTKAKNNWINYRKEKKQKKHTQNRIGTSSVSISAIIIVVGVFAFCVYDSSMDVGFSFGKWYWSVGLSKIESIWSELLFISLENDNISWSGWARLLCF